MVRRNAKQLFLGTATTVGLVFSLVFLLSGHWTAEAQVRGQKRPARPRAQREAGPVQVGTYDEKAVFQAHPAQQQVQTAMQTAQTQLQQAQQQRDQQKMQQIQQQYEQARSQAVQQFRQDVARALPKIAQAADVQVVAMEVVYKADEVKTVDLTRSLTQALAKLNNQPAKAQPKPQYQLPGRKGGRKGGRKRRSE